MRTARTEPILLSARILKSNVNTVVRWNKEGIVEMIPLYEKLDSGTDYTTRWRISPLALYLIACGWAVEAMVVSPKLAH